MNSNSPVATGAAGVTTVVSGAVVIWFCQNIGVTPPDMVVAGAIGALLVSGVHSLSNFIQTRWPARNQTVSVPVEVKAAPVTVETKTLSIGATP